jgi:bifunctional DNase/RNase
MEKIELQILGISSGHTAASYTLILEERNGPRKLPIIIGAFEAQAIAIEIEKIVPQRPMTHDLFKSMAQAFDIEVKEVVIHRLQEGVFFSSVLCTNGSVEEEVDARTSDAIALALRFKCPIYTYEAIMQEAGIILTDIAEATEEQLQQEEEKTAAQPAGSTKTTAPENLSSMSKDQLETLLTEALDVENYILAAKIRDELKKRP